MVDVTILPELGEKCPEMALGQIQCKVFNSKYNEELWIEIKALQDEIRDNHQFDSIRQQENIKKTRDVYKACGKDPHRYRPSAESLHRRIVKGNDLYQINTLVDAVNLFSLKSGYSIGGFDADLIKGKVIAGIGKKSEPFEGIGRGELNIEGLPVLRDEIGSIGTPTSDEIRTAIRDNTTNFFMNVNGYTGEEKLIGFLNYTIEKLKKYVGAAHIEKRILTYNTNSK